MLLNFRFQLLRSQNTCIITLCLQTVKKNMCGNDDNIGNAFKAVAIIVIKGSVDTKKAIRSKNDANAGIPHARQWPSPVATNYLI